MRPKRIESTLKSFGTPILFLVGILIVWEAIVAGFGIPAYLLPPPSKILPQLTTDNFFLLKHLGITMSEAVLGFLLANLLGFVAAVGFAHSRSLEKAVYPYAIALKTTPIIAMAPLLILWLGSGLLSKVVCSALICFFPILVNATKGLRSVEEEALDLFESLSASKWQIFVKLRLPSSLPFVFSALKISTSLSIVGAIVGEFVGASSGLGYLILVSSYHLETDVMFAAIIASSVGGVAFFGIVSLVESKLLFWQKPIE